MWLFLFHFILISTVFSAYQEPKLQESACQLGQIFVNGKCLSFAAPGTPCMVSQQCLDSSVCVKNRCICTDPEAEIINNYCIVPSKSCLRTQAMVNGQCETLTLPDKECVGEGQCVGGSRCLNIVRLVNQRNSIASVCKCDAFFASMHGYCIPNIPQCTKQQMLGNNSCRDILNLGENCEVFVDGQCLPFADPGTTCVVTQQCRAGKQCVADRFTNRRICADGMNCPSGQVAVHGMCLIIVRSGGFCQDSQQCADNGQCVNGICQSSNDGRGNVFPSVDRFGNIFWT